MCDYSLEIYRTRPARKGERYTLHRFPSGAKGFVAPGDCTTAVCIAPDTKLVLSELPEELGGFRGSEGIEVTFMRLDEGWYRDGVRFPDGLEVSLQKLPLGVNAAIVEALEESAASVKVPELVD